MQVHVKIKCHKLGLTIYETVLLDEIYSAGIDESNKNMKILVSLPKNYKKCKVERTFCV